MKTKIGPTQKTIKEGMCNKCKGSHFKASKSVGKTKKC